MSVQPRSDTVYMLQYSPERVGPSEGLVLFTGRPDGELSYRVLLEGTDPDPVHLVSPQCELGK